MLPSLATLNSRLEEESRIVARWVAHLERCLEDPRLFSKAIESAGISRNDLASGMGLSLHQLDRAVNQARRHRPDVRLRLMKSLEAPDIGLQGFAAMSSDRVDKALEIALTYHDVTSDRYDLDLLIEKKQAIIRPVIRTNYLRETVDIAEDSIAGMWRLLELFLGRGAKHEFQQASAHFDYPAPAYVDAYEAAFLCQFHFECDRTELRFPAEWLTRPVATANPAVAQLCHGMCERILGPRRRVVDAPDEVARLLLSRSGRRILALEEAAERMNMSSSQLRKRLYRAGTSYKRIVVDTRMTLARHYLETSRLSIQNIAYLLDYSEAAAFSRAFKRQFDVSPQQYREQARQNEHGESDERPVSRPLRSGKWVVQ